MSSMLDDHFDTGVDDATSLATITREDDGLYRDTAGRVWIPPEACDLQMRVCIIAHTGLGGHRGYRSTLTTFRKFCTWDTIDIGR